MPLDATTRHILLCGLSGSGKSTVGRLLADHLGISFVDLDRLIAEREGISVPELFSARGEAGFRAAEAGALRAAIAGPRAVVALGGGALVSPGNRRRVMAGGQLIWLQVSPMTASERCAQSEVRPLLAGAPMAQLTELLAERTGAYSQADIIVSTDHQPPEAVCAKIAEQL